jgi:hypothetical protein
MKFSEVLSAIESTRFAAQANLASGYKTFFRLVYEHEAVVELLKKLSKSLRQRHLVLARIRQLVKKEFDLEYSNPWDVALATYLQTLSLVDLDLAQEGAMIVARTPNCWWSTRTAQHLLTYSKFKESKSSTSVSQYELGPELKYPNTRQQTKTLVTQEVRQTIPAVGQSVRSFTVASQTRTVSPAAKKRSHLDFSVKASSSSSKVLVTS